VGVEEKYSSQTSIALVYPPYNLEIKMISLLGSLLGFGSSLIGPVLKTWNKSSDQKHELAMLHAQAEVHEHLDQG
jgi:hypothetical protein